MEGTGKHFNENNDKSEKTKISGRAKCLWETLRKKVRDKDAPETNENRKRLSISEILEKEDDVELVEAMVTAIIDVKEEIDKNRDGTDAAESSVRAKTLWGSVKTKLKNGEIHYTDGENNLDEVLEEVHDMVVTLSSQKERQHCRREGMSERSEIERMLVQKTLEHWAQLKNARDVTEM